MPRKIMVSKDAGIPCIIYEISDPRSKSAHKGVLQVKVLKDTIEILGCKIQTSPMTGLSQNYGPVFALSSFSLLGHREIF